MDFIPITCIHSIHGFSLFCSSIQIENLHSSDVNFCKNSVLQEAFSKEKCSINRIISKYLGITKNLVSLHPTVTFALLGVQFKVLQVKYMKC